MKVWGGLSSHQTIYLAAVCTEAVLEISPLLCLCLFIHTQGDILSCAVNTVLPFSSVSFYLFLASCTLSYTMTHDPLGLPEHKSSQQYLACARLCAAAKTNFQGCGTPCAGTPVARTRFSSLMFKSLHNWAR